MYIRILKIEFDRCVENRDNDVVVSQYEERLTSQKVTLLFTVAPFHKTMEFTFQDPETDRTSTFQE